MKQKKQLFILAAYTLALLVVVFVVPHFVQAAGLVPCGGDPPEKPCGLPDVFILIARVTNWLLRVAGVYAVYKIVQAGFGLTITQGEEEAITKNKKQMTEAVVGFVLTLMAYLFVNTIVNFILLRNFDKCHINLKDPLTYLSVKTYDDAACKAQHQQVHDPVTGQ